MSDQSNLPAAGDGAGHSRVPEPLEDQDVAPGLPAHVWRPTDVDPKAEKRAERQVAALFVFPSWEHTRLPDAELELLAALGEHRDVHLWLPVASTAVARALDAHAPVDVAAPVRADHDTDVLVHHPLLAALGRDARELGLRLAAVPGVAVVTHDGRIVTDDQGRMVVTEARA